METQERCLQTAAPPPEGPALVPRAATLGSGRFYSPGGKGLGSGGGGRFSPCVGAPPPARLGCPAADGWPISCLPRQAVPGGGGGQVRASQ